MTSHNPHHDPSLLTREVFLARRPHDPLHELAIARWRTLADDERRRRSTAAFDVLFDDGVELDDDDGYREFDLDAHPDLGWTQTQVGRRAVEALMRLTEEFDERRATGDWPRAWKALELATHFFGASVWLAEQQLDTMSARVTSTDADHDLSWVRELLDGCEYDSTKLVAHYLIDATDTQIVDSLRLAIRTVEELGRPPSEQAALQAFTAGSTEGSEHLHDLALALAAHAHREINNAMTAADLQRLANAVQIGAIALKAMIHVSESDDHRPP